MAPKPQINFLTKSESELLQEILAKSAKDLDLNNPDKLFEAASLSSKLHQFMGVSRMQEELMFQQQQEPRRPDHVDGGPDGDDDNPPKKEVSLDE